MCGIAGEISFTGGADVAAVERMAAVLAPRGPDGSGTHAEIADIVEPDFLADRDASREFVPDYFDRPGTDAPVDRALRLDTEVMLVDDPVKRVDNMTMAWGLEGRVPFLDHELVELAACPPELKLAQGGKGVLKDAGRRVLPVGVVDRKKGYFPVPALIHLEGPFLDLVETALRSPEAAGRGLLRPEYVDRLLAAPNDQRTPLGANKVWQLGVLELWLQAHGLRPPLRPVNGAPSCSLARQPGFAYPVEG